MRISNRPVVIRHMQWNNYCISLSVKLMAGIGSLASQTQGTLPCELPVRTALGGAIRNRSISWQRIDESWTGASDNTPLNQTSSRSNEVICSIPHRSNTCKKVTIKTQESTGQYPQQPLEGSTHRRPKRPLLARQWSQAKDGHNSKHPPEVDIYVTMTPAANFKSHLDQTENIANSGQPLSIAIPNNLQPPIETQYLPMTPVSMRWSQANNGHNSKHQPKEEDIYVAMTPPANFNSHLDQTENITNSGQSLSFAIPNNLRPLKETLYCNIHLDQAKNISGVRQRSSFAIPNNLQPPNQPLCLPMKPISRQWSQANNGHNSKHQPKKEDIYVAMTPQANRKIHDMVDPQRTPEENIYEDPEDLQIDGKSGAVLKRDSRKPSLHWKTTPEEHIYEELELTQSYGGSSADLKYDSRKPFLVSQRPSREHIYEELELPQSSGRTTRASGAAVLRNYGNQCLRYMVPCAFFWPRTSEPFADDYLEPNQYRLEESTEVGVAAKLPKRNTGQV